MRAPGAAARQRRRMCNFAGQPSAADMNARPPRGMDCRRLCAKTFFLDALVHASRGPRTTRTMQAGDVSAKKFPGDSRSSMCQPCLDATTAGRANFHSLRQPDGCRASTKNPHVMRTLERPPLSVIDTPALRANDVHAMSTLPMYPPASPHPDQGMTYPTARTPTSTTVVPAATTATPRDAEGGVIERAEVKACRALLVESRICPCEDSNCRFADP